MKDNIVKFIATYGYTGYFPVASGTFASAVAVGMCYFLKSNLTLYIAVFLVITIVGFLVSDRMEELAGQKDPGCIVIDEAAGIMISFFMLPWTPSVVWTAFFLFRAFDMFKIYPVNRLEEFKGGVGVMLDDIFAGIYTNLTMHIALKLIGA